MLPALLIFLTYMLTCYSFAHLLSGAYHYQNTVLKELICKAINRVVFYLSLLSI